jgi:large subunit ribosomal protein L10
MDRNEKASFIADLSAKVSSARLAVVADYRGMDVATITGFRKQLSTSRVAELRVVKNTLTRRAIAGTAFEGLGSLLQGPNALLIASGDVVEAAKTVTEFAKSVEKFALKGGVLDGKAIDLDGLKALATLPPKEQLQAQLLGVLQAPARNFVSLLANANRQIVNVLAAYRDQLEKQA